MVSDGRGQIIPAGSAILDLPLTGKPTWAVRAGTTAAPSTADYLRVERAGLNRDHLSSVSNAAVDRGQGGDRGRAVDVCFVGTCTGGIP